MPAHLQTLTLAVGGKVRVVSQQKTVSLREEVATRVATIDETKATSAAFLLRSTEGYTLRIVGKGGEALGGRAARLSLQHTLLTNAIDVALATDERGDIQLGELPGVRAFEVRIPGEIEVVQRFELASFVSTRAPTGLVVIEGEPLALPLGPMASPADTAPSWQLVEVRGRAATEDVSATARLVGSVLRIDEPCAGTYEVRGADGVIARFTVLPGSSRVAGGWGRSGQTLRECHATGAVLESVEVTPDGLEVEVGNAGAETRVVVLPTPFWPNHVWTETLGGPLRTLDVHPGARRRTETLSGRDIGDEYRYVLDRGRHPRRPGTLLERPGLLLNPFALRTTRSSIQVARDGADWRSRSGSNMAMAGAGGEVAESEPEPLASRGLAGGKATPIDPAFVTHDFLAQPPKVLANLVPDAAGRVVVPTSALEAASVVRVLCVDPTRTTGTTVALARAPLAVRDNRLAAPLPAADNLCEVRVLEPLSDPSVLVEGHGAPRYEVVGTIDGLYRALCSLSGDEDLARWSFLARWSELDREQRLAIYDEHACHELSLFVRFKDRELFEEVVQPYLRNKLHPTFIDRFLLGGDLSRYLEPLALHRLNAIEVALLARTLPSGSPEREALVRRLADAVELRSPAVTRALDDRFVEIVLAGGAARDDPSEPEPSESPPPSAPKKQARRGRRRRAAPMANRGGDDDVQLVSLDEREEQAPLYRSIDKTREWAEHNWWQRPIAEQNAGLVRPSRLWQHLATHTEGPFLSPFLADAGERFAAAVVALAVTDLPFAAPEASAVVETGGVRLTSATPALVARAVFARLAGEPSGEALVGQATFRGDDRWDWEEGERREKPVSGELLVGTRYEDEIVVSNPTSRSQVLEVLVQIPAGSLPVGGSTATHTHRLKLDPYATKTVEVQYYFPAAGTFEQYGARVSRAATLVAVAPSRTFTVSHDPAVGDPDAWPILSQHGSLDDVVRYLATRNLHRIALSKIAWRMADREAFARITATLSERFVYDHVLWSYALRHRDRVRLREWLSMQDSLAEEVGPLSCDLVVVDPLHHGHYQHLEYAPLVNARAHQLGEHRRVLDDGLDAQWQALLDRLATVATRNPDDWLAASQALLTMDRTEEAGSVLARVDAAEPVPLQQAYLRAWLAMSSGDLATARALASSHRDQPVPRWRNRFRALLAVLDEVEGVDGEALGSEVRDDRESRMGELATRQPTFTAMMEGRSLVLHHENIDALVVNAYPMDVELLFSRQPFLAAAEDRFLLVEPAASTTVEASATGRTELDLSDLLESSGARNAVIEVVAGPIRHVLSWFESDLVVTIASAYGRLSVRRASDRAPLSATYVKVYARMHDDRVAFFKDGYTDLRGWFDYATLSTDELDRVSRFALLVVHDEAGVSVVETEPPSR